MVVNVVVLLVANDVLSSYAVVVVNVVFVAKVVFVWNVVVLLVANEVLSS